MLLPHRPLLAFVLSAASLAAAEGWLTDLDEAKKVAAKEQKAILVDFTGSDWCGWCIRLREEVFDKPEFKEASKHFVLVELDFPRKKQLPAGQKEKNEALARKFDVRGFPTILLMNASGEPFAKTGYEPGGPVKYVAALRDALQRNNAEGVKSFREQLEAESRADELGEKIEEAIASAVEKKDLKAAEAAIEETLKAAGAKGELRVSMLARYRIGVVARCKPGDFGALLKATDEIIAEAADSPLLPKLKAMRGRIEEAAARKSEGK
ncbi:MAG: thioredoxin family protein [Opitutales bacterium]